VWCVCVCEVAGGFAVVEGKMSRLWKEEERKSLEKHGGHRGGGKSSAPWILFFLFLSSLSFFFSLSCPCLFFFFTFFSLGTLTQQHSCECAFVCVCLSACVCVFLHHNNNTHMCVCVCVCAWGNHMQVTRERVGVCVGGARVGDSLVVA